MTIPKTIFDRRERLDIMFQAMVQGEKPTQEEIEILKKEIKRLYRSDKECPEAKK